MAYDYCVVGGGIVGLATAMKLLEMQPSAGGGGGKKADTGNSERTYGESGGVKIG